MAQDLTQNQFMQAFLLAAMIVANQAHRNAPPIINERANQSNNDVVPAPANVEGHSRNASNNNNNNNNIDDDDDDDDDGDVNVVPTPLLDTQGSSQSESAMENDEMEGIPEVEVNNDVLLVPPPERTFFESEENAKEFVHDFARRHGFGISTKKDYRSKVRKRNLSKPLQGHPKSPADEKEHWNQAHQLPFQMGNPGALYWLAARFKDF